MPALTDTRHRLSWGQRGSVPTDAPACWGARAIWDGHGSESTLGLLWDRQDMDPNDSMSERMRLQHALNGPGGSDGLLRQAGVEFARLARTCEWTRASGSSENAQRTLAENDEAIIVGSPRGSYGYVYLAAWLKPSESGRDCKAECHILGVCCACDKCCSCGASDAEWDAAADTGAP